MKVEATAFAPGHITGFFEIQDAAADPAQKGSRGAGFSVMHGVQSRVRISDEGFPGVRVVVNGEVSDAATTRRAIDLLAGDRGLEVDVDQTMQLPVSQGLGMSSAGALSAALALAETLQLARREAVWAAHCADVFQRTGLGDVVGAAAGGFEARAKPGVEPFGEVRAWTPDAPVGPVLLAQISDAVLTRRVLTDPARRANINRIGAGLVDRFLEGPSLTAFVDASRRFSLETGLASPEIARLYAARPGLAMGQCQLGGSVFAFGVRPEVRASFAGYTVFETQIDPHGARVSQARRSA